MKSSSPMFLSLLCAIALVPSCVLSFTPHTSQLTTRTRQHQQQTRTTSDNSLKLDDVRVSTTRLQETSTDGDRVSKPRRSPVNISEIASNEDLGQFLTENDDICVIKFYASWCKSCQKFGVQFRQLGSQLEGVRMAQIEYGSNLELCRSLGVKKLPTVMIFSKGNKLDDFPCGPKKFPLLVEKMNHLVTLSQDELDFEASMHEGTELGNDMLSEILSSTKEPQPESRKQRKLFGIF